MSRIWQALSVKQPWAALLVHGIKTIEVRSWQTGKRGPILIHASRSAEEDPNAWDQVLTTEVMTTAGLVGGFIGVVEIKCCIKYNSVAEFKADFHRHLARPARFKPPAMFGFEIVKPQLIDFIPANGFTSLFGVEVNPKPIGAPVKLKRPRNKDQKYLVRLPEEWPGTY